MRISRLGKVYKQIEVLGELCTPKTSISLLWIQENCQVAMGA
ncbi:MAG: hypothetical protein AAFU78_11910 [Cyanobacteria bacterium J06633_2]